MTGQRDADQPGGDAACWLHDLCPACGAMPTADQPDRCWRCGHTPTRGATPDSPEEHRAPGD